MDFSSPLAIRLLLLFPILFVGILLTCYGQTRRGILFGVSVSLDFARSHLARAALRNYRIQVLAVGFTDLLVSAILVWTPARLLSPRILVALFAVPSELIAAYFLWHHQARIVEPYASIVPAQRHAELVPPSTLPPLIAQILSLIPLALTALFLHRHWYQLPLRWPIHWNLSGSPNAWATRTTAGVFGPLATGLVVVLIFIAISLFMARASGPEALQRRRALTPLAALSWLIAVLFCFTGLLPLTHAAPDRLMLIIAIYIAIVIGITLWLLHCSGLVPASKSTAPHDSTPDARWYGGLLYYNPSDAAVLVPKRFGLGWTLNFARPASWIYLAAILLFCLALIVLIK